MLAESLKRHYLRLRYAPFLSQIIVTRRCNLACTYCSEFDQVSEVVPDKILRQRIDQVAALGSFGLELTGGEPLLHPQIVELVQHASQYHFRMLGLISNGFLLSERRVEELNQTGLTDLQISVDGVEPNDMTLKTLRPLRSKLDALARRARFKVVLCAVVGSGAPFAEVAEVIQFARDHGFRPRILLVHGTDGQLDRRVHDLRSYHRLQRLIGRHYQDLFDYRDALFERGEAPFRCRAGSRYLYVDEGGLVHWCAQTRTGWGKPLAEYTTVDLRRQFYTFKNCNLSCTLGCVRSCSMLDRWFPQERPSVPR